MTLVQLRHFVVLAACGSYVQASKALFLTQPRIDHGDTTQLSRDHTELQHLIDTGQAQAGIEYASVYHALSDCLIADLCPSRELFMGA